MTFRPQKRDKQVAPSGHYVLLEPFRSVSAQTVLETYTYTYGVMGGSLRLTPPPPLLTPTPTIGSTPPPTALLPPPPSAAPISPRYTPPPPPPWLATDQANRSPVV